ncbi:MAG: hypothetical protein ACYDHC_11495, partial [Desulfuromonadaceae bacterium]
MSQIKPSHLIISMALALALGGCGDKNDKAIYSAEGVGHTSDWVTSHKTSANSDLNSCIQCHGNNLTGGISKVGCFSTSQSSFNGFACHATNPIVNTNCKSCHDTPPSGTAAPNRAGAHAKHLTMYGMACSTCHNGGGSGTANHARGTVTVSPLPLSY